MRFEATLCRARFLARDQFVSCRNRELRLPVMALAVRGRERVAHLLLFRRRGPQAASVHLRNVCHGLIGEEQRLRELVLIKTRVHLVPVCWGRTAARDV